jgi:hypothetical protein
VPPPRRRGRGRRRWRASRAGCAQDRGAITGGGARVGEGPEQGAVDLKAVAAIDQRLSEDHGCGGARDGPKRSPAPIRRRSLPGAPVSADHCRCHGMRQEHQPPPAGAVEPWSLQSTSSDFTRRHGCPGSALASRANMTANWPQLQINCIRSTPGHCRNCTAGVPAGQQLARRASWPCWPSAAYPAGPPPEPAALAPGGAGRRSGDTVGPAGSGARPPVAGTRL